MLTATRPANEFIDRLKRLCAQLGDGHTFISLLNNPRDKADWIRPLPFKTKRVGNRVFVTTVYDSGFEKQGLCRGCEVLKIDGMDVIEYAALTIQCVLHQT